MPSKISRLGETRREALVRSLAEEVRSQESQARRLEQLASSQVEKLASSKNPTEVVCQVLPPSWALREEVQNFEDGKPAFIQCARLDNSISHTDSTECSSSGEPCELASLDHDCGGNGESFKRPNLWEVSAAALDMCSFRGTRPDNGVQKIFKAMAEVLLADVREACLEEAVEACLEDQEEESDNGAQNRSANTRSVGGPGGEERQRLGEARLAALVEDENGEAIDYGAAGHPLTCVPCTFFVAKRGCRNNTACLHCHHEDHWHQRADYLRSRQRKRQRNRNSSSKDAHLTDSACGQFSIPFIG